jgi:hypothetical protein
MSSAEPVIRFCPKCGARAKAAPEAFATPQACPQCKTKVLFWDVTKEPTGDLLKAMNMKPLLPTQLIWPCLVAAGVFANIVLALFFFGFIGIPFTLAIFFLLLGLACVGMFLAQQYKLEEERKQITQLVETFDATREQQVGLGIKYSSLQENFRSLVETANREANETKRKYEEKLATLERDVEEKLQIELRRIEQREQEAMRKASTAESDALKRVNQVEFEAKATVRSIAIKYLDETKKILIAKLTADNLTQTNDRFQKAVEFVKKVGFPVPQQDVDQFVDELRREYTAELRRQLAREEQARIKEKLRDDAKAEAEYQREMKRREQETKLYERLLTEARSKATAESTAQIQELEKKLAEAQENQRSLSMAQQTKAGRVYVISNIGSFGEGVFKIGMTRRLEYMDRIKELGDASVPFPFDVHMMIACDNAPGLENELHKRFNQHRINKVNFRKEFFRVSVEEIKQIVEELHGEVEYVVDPEALEYRESLTMTDEQFEMVTNISHEVGMDDEDDDRS